MDANFHMAGRSSALRITSPACQSDKLPRWKVLQRRPTAHLVQSVVHLSSTPSAIGAIVSRVSGPAYLATRLASVCMHRPALDDPPRESGRPRNKLVQTDRRCIKHLPALDPGMLLQAHLSYHLGASHSCLALSNRGKPSEPL